MARTGPNPIEIQRELLWRRSATDPLFFLDEFWHVQTIGKGYANFDPWPHQPKIIAGMGASIENAMRPFESRSTSKEDSLRRLYLKARQIGFTTIGCGVAFWCSFFHDHHPWLVVSTGEDEAKDTLQLKIENPYSMLPAWMRRRGPQVETDTSEEFGFDNGSRILAIPSTARSGRSKAVFGVLLDEAAFQEDAEGLFAALEPLCYGPMFMFSTANGMGNMFHENWLDAQLEDSEWVSEFYPWDVVPGRTQTWFDQKTRLYRKKPHLLAQEYPHQPDEAFMRSGRTGLNMDLLREIDYPEPVKRLDLAMWLQYDGAIPDKLHPTAYEVDTELWVWKEPRIERDEHGFLRRKPNYVIGADIAEGLEHGDASAIAVLDVNNWEFVATCVTSIPVYALGALISSLGRWYHDALVVVERNNFGLVPLSWLVDHWYPRLYRMESFAQIQMSDRTPRYGFHTNRATKPKMVNEFNSELADGTIVLNDRRFLLEAQTFLQDGHGGYGANPPNNDDLILAHLLALQGGLDVGEYPIVWRDPETMPLTMADVLKPMIDVQRPAGYALGQPIGQGSTMTPVRAFEVPRKG